MSRISLRRPRATIALTAGLASIAAATAVALVACNLVRPGPISTIDRVEFDRPLAIPPLADSSVASDGTRVFSLTAQAGVTEFEPGIPSDTWGFDGAYLGPTLVADRGERVRVDIANDLAEPTTVHWHGMHLPAEMDGGPHEAIDPGTTRSPEWRIDQPAATLWYHPHPHEETEDQVAKGMAGMFLLRDEAERALGLPSEYGVDDIPVIVQDTGFSADGRREGPLRGFVGALGDELLVNGTRSPYLDVEHDVVRLRLLNASTGRTYAFGWSDGRPVEVIATDGGLLETSAPLDKVLLSPGERAELLVRMIPGERVALRSDLTPADAGLTDGDGATNGFSDSFDVLELRAAETLTTSRPVPEVLADLPEVDPSEAATTRSFRLDDTEINGRDMDMGRIDETVEIGSLERWLVDNPSGQPHSFHVHGMQFRVASINGAPPPPELAGWKDTIFVQPENEYELLLRFDDYADPGTPYMYHCHLLWHEDQGMMGQFAVVDPVERATMTEEITDHDH